MDEHIKVKGVIPRVQYISDGVQNRYDYPFVVFNASEIVIYIGEVLLTSSEYQVFDVAETNGGYVILNTVPDIDSTITILRQMVIERMVDFQEGGTFRSKTMNDELDKLTAFVQQVEEKVDRALTYPEYSSLGQIQVPSNSVPGSALIWNEEGSAVINSSFNISTLQEELDLKQNVLIAGENITIDEETISAIIIKDHNELANRDIANQHPISSIIGLQDNLDLKANLTVLDNYATTIDLSNGLSLKADKTQLEDYATITELNSGLNNKADKTQLSSYATTLALDSGLATKADLSYVNTELGLKANQSSLNTLATVVDGKQEILVAGENISIIGNVISSVGGSGGTSNHALLTNRDANEQHPISAITGLQSAIDSKANTSALSSYATTTALNNGLALKADKTQLSSYATTSALTSGLATKANTADLSDVATSGSYNDLTGLPNLSQYATTTQLNTKADTSYVNTQLGGKVNSNLTNITLSTAGNTLANGTYNRNITGNTVFVLPSPIPNQYNQIEVKIKMTTVYTIDVGENTEWVNGEALDMSTAGRYTLIWTYDFLESIWTVGGYRNGA